MKDETVAKEFYPCTKCQTIHRWNKLCPVCFRNETTTELNTIRLSPKELGGLTLEEVEL